MKNTWLDSDKDAALTVKSLKTFDDLIKQGSNSSEQIQLRKQINKYLWNDIHCVKEQLFDFAIGSDYNSDGEMQQPGMMSSAFNPPAKLTSHSSMMMGLSKFQKRNAVNQKLLDAAAYCVTQRSSLSTM